MRPEEGGRYVICCWTEGQKDFQSLTPENFSSRTTVHEYGGGAFFVYKYRIYFSNFEDQRLYCQKLKKLGSEPTPLTPKGKDWRYADGTIYKKHIVVCVREDHEVIGGDVKEAENTLVSINRKTQEQSVLVSCLGSDLKTLNLWIFTAIFLYNYRNDFGHFFETYCCHSKYRKPLNISPIPLIKYGKKSLL